MSTLYAEHFQLKEAPFSIAPNPRFLFMSEQHREALAHLLYGIGHDGGFVLLTGEVGTGKTTLCRCLLEKVPDDTDVAFIINPRLSVVDLLANICDELHITYDKDRLNNRLLVDAINHYLLAQHAEGRKTVLVIDEAQNLEFDVLEQLRLLTNLETDERKLLQIILLGQPELQEKLSRPELRQLSQRVTARYHLEALGRSDLQAYIAHRLGVAGCNLSIFTPAALRFVQRRSGGIPRLINLICDRAMLGAFARGVRRIERAMAVQAAREVLGEQPGSHRTRRSPLWLKVAGVSLLVAATAWAGTQWFQSQPAAQPGLPTSAQAEPSASTATPVTSVEPEQPAIAPPAPSGSEDVPQVESPVIDPTAPESAAIEPAVIDPAAIESTGQDRQAAFGALFARWGIALPNDADPCAFAQTQGLACLKLVGDVGKLRSLDRPAMIDWQGDNGATFITLTAIDGTHARAMLGGEAIDMPLTTLQLHWKDSFTLLWRVPTAYRSDILPGTVGPSAIWLNRRLLKLDPPEVAPEKIPGIYDGEWVPRLRRFQREAGLLPDGVAGPQTLIRLNTALNEPGPRLSQAAAEVATAPEQTTVAR